MFNVKIVKSFSSNEYAVKANDYWPLSKNTNNPYLEWGLSSDGELCCRAHFGVYCYPTWTPYEHTAFPISLVEMKVIVKEFGHLLPFI